MSDNRVVVITGGGTGIGAATAVDLARTGTKVVIAGRRRAPLEEVAERIKREGGECLARPADVRDFCAMEEICREAVERYGKVDVLIPNAAVHDVSSIDSGDPQWWRTLIEINVLGLMFAVRAFLPQFLKQGYGHILVVSSLSGRVTYVGEPIYAASKHAQVAFVDCLRKEVTEKNVKVSIVEPGLVDTPLTDNPFAQELKKTVPPLDAEDVARAVRFIIDQPDNVTIYELSMRPKKQLL